MFLNMGNWWHYVQFDLESLVFEKGCFLIQLVSARLSMKTVGFHDILMQLLSTSFNRLNVHFH